MIALGAFSVSLALALFSFAYNRALLAAGFLTICVIIANGAAT